MRNSISIKKTTVVLILLIILATLFSACNIKKSDKVTVTFMDGKDVLMTLVDEQNFLEFTPDKTGYDFKGWFLDDKLTSPCEISPNYDTTLYAKWEKKKFIVQFLDFDDSVLQVNGQNSQTVYYGESAVAPDNPNREGYVFSKWNRDFENVKSDLTIKPLYNLSTNTLKIYVAGKEELCEEIKANTKLFSKINDVLDKTELPFGFSFSNWCSDPQLQNDVEINENTVMGNADTALYAKLKINDISNLNLCVENNKFDYDENLSINFNAQFDDFSEYGIDYSYKWFYKAVSKTPIEGQNGKTLTLTGLDVGEYTLCVEITASAEYCTSINATAEKNISIAAVDLTGVTTEESVTVMYDGAYHGIDLVGLKDGDSVSYRINDDTDYVSDFRKIDVGRYEVEISINRVNYNPLIISSTLDIIPALLTVTAKSYNLYYGDELPTYDYDAVGFVNGEDSSVLTGSALYICKAENTLVVGVYELSVDGLRSNNYSISFVKGSLNIKKRPLTIYAVNETVTYGDNAPVLTAGYEGFIDGENADDLIGNLQYRCDYTSESPYHFEGYPIFLDGVSSDNYDIEFISGVLIVNKKLLTVRVKDIAVEYGSTPVFSAIYEGFVNGDDESVVKGISFSCDYTVGCNAGTLYDVSASNASSDNYVFEYIKGTLNVTQKSLTITAEDKEIIYGNVAPNYTVKYEGFVNGDDESVISGLKINCAYKVGDGVKGYEIIPDSATNVNYDITFIAGTLNVTKKGLTITAEDKEIIYGNVAPNYTVKYEGFVNGDDESVISGLKINCAYKVGDGVKGYEIIPDSATNVNYDITFIAGTLNVTKKGLTITAEDKEIIYGDTVPNDYGYKTSGLIEGDSIAMLGGSALYRCAYAKGSNVGDYEIEISGLSSDNYLITFEVGTLTVKTRQITLSKDTIKVYDEKSWVCNASDLEISNLYANDVVSGEIATSAANIATYIAKGDLSSSFVWNSEFRIVRDDVDVTDNYILVFNLSVEIINNKFSIEASGVNTVYDGQNHSVSVTVVDDFAEISYSIDGNTFTSSNPTYINVGTYTVYFKVSDKNGNLTDYTGTKKVVITPAELILNAISQTINYGDAAADFTYSAIGFVNNEDYSILKGSPIYYCNYNTGDNVGNYDISLSGLSADNYTISYGVSQLTVERRQLTVRVKDIAVEYGSTPVFSAIYEGFVNGDDESVVKGISFSCDYTVGCNAGTLYDVSASNASSDNYVFEYIKGTLNVTQKSLTITAEDKEIIYGNVAPNYTVKYEGFVNGDDESVISGLKINCAYKVGDGVKGYEIIPDSATNVNYDITFIAGTLNVTKKGLTITAEDKEIIYGDTVPNDYGYKTSGLIEGDSIAMLGGSALYRCAYAKGSNVGDYEIEISGLSSDNYLISFKKGNLHVVAKSVEINWSGLNNKYVYNSLNQSDAITASFINNDNETIYLDIEISGKSNIFMQAGEYTLVASISDSNYLLTNYSKSVTMDKATYQNIVYTDIFSRTYDPELKLSDFKLADNYFWSNASQTPTCDITSYPAIYNADKSNFYDYSLNITVKLDKLSVYLKNDRFNYNFTGSNNQINVELFYLNKDNVETAYDVTSPVYSQGNSFAKAGTYKTIVSIEAINYEMIPTACYIKVKGVKIGEDFYTIEDAIKQAVAGQIIIVTTNTFFADFEGIAELYNGNEYYTVKPGVILLMPISENDTKGYLSGGIDGDKNSGVNYSAHPDNCSVQNLYITLDIPKNVTLYNNGKIVVGAVTGSKATGPYQNKISGNYCQINLEGNIEATDSYLESYGFIKGNGTITANNSNIIENMHLSGWMGGTLSAVRYAGNESISTLKLLSNNEITFNNPFMFPFSQYELRSIQTKLILNYSCTLQGFAKIATSEQSKAGITIKAQINEANVNIISSSADSSAGILRMTAESRITKTFANNRVKLQLDGNIYDGYCSISIKVLKATLTTSSKSVYFPIDGRTDILIKSGTFTQSYKFKLMPGATLTVAENATYNLNSSLVLYTKDFKDENTFPYPSAERGNAKLFVNGTFFVNGSFGGDIQSSGNGITIISAGATITNVKSIEGGGTMDISVLNANCNFVEGDSAIRNAELINGDGTIINPENGATYLYAYDSSSGKWKWSKQ